MRLWVAAIGRMRPGPLLELQNEYAKRIGRDLVLKEVEERRKLAPAELRRRESELLLGAIPSGALRVVLDERGQTLSSEVFAARLGAWRDAGTPDLAFMVGGADGHEASVRDGAALVLGFGAMTWPHLLARIMLLEQLYRARQILAGHPYHRA
jgi:23S rRNA (pseudouridine1915-N3)-methyltransferase